MLRIIIRTVFISFAFTLNLGEAISQVDCWDPSKSSGPSKISIQLYGGSDYDMSSLSTNETEPNQYLSERNMSTSFIGSYKIGGLLKYHATPRLYIKAGLEFKDSNERFNYQLEQENMVTTPNQPIGMQVDASGNVTTILGDLVSIEITTETYEHYNDFKSYSIPILVGYSILDKDKLSIAVEGGISQNISFAYDGTILDSNLIPVENASNYYKNSIGLGLLAGIELGYTLSEKTSFILGVHGKSPLSAINDRSINQIDEKLTAIGALVGIEYSF